MRATEEIGCGYPMSGNEETGLSKLDQDQGSIHSSRNGGVIMDNFLDGFSGVNRPEHVFEFLDHVDAMDSVQKIKRRMAEIASVGQGQKVLDVGCGLARDQ